MLLIVGEVSVYDMCGVVNMIWVLLIEFVCSSLEFGVVVGIIIVIILFWWSNVDKVKINWDVFGKIDWIDDVGKWVFMCCIFNVVKVEMVVVFICCVEDGVYVEKVFVILRVWFVDVWCILVLWLGDVMWVIVFWMEIEENKIFEDVKRGVVDVKMFRNLSFVEGDFFNNKLFVEEFFLFLVVGDGWM